MLKQFFPRKAKYHLFSRKRNFAIVVWHELSCRHCSRLGGCCLLYRNFFFFPWNLLPQMLGGVSAALWAHKGMWMWSISLKQPYSSFAETSSSFGNDVVRIQLGKYLHESCCRAKDFCSYSSGFLLLLLFHSWVHVWEDLCIFNYLLNWEFSFWIWDLPCWNTHTPTPRHTHWFWPSALGRERLCFSFASL